MKENRLALEKSPYLLQHKNNPVDWYPWGEAAFREAKERDCPIFLSIGYSTCYWCHVMERDSFEDEAVAEKLNKYFVCIKVDREERPDVDSIYMDVVTGLTGHGGWPMTVLLTPELKPFWGGTFFWKAQLLSIADQVDSAWKNDRLAVNDSSDKICQAILGASLKPEAGFISQDIFEQLSAHSKSYFDEKHGGFGGAPKFPSSEHLSSLLRMYSRSNDKRLLEIVERTLAAMAKGGIHDQLGGGFHRYSVDERWLVPHFEKMLYDNALLARVYLECFLTTKNELYREAASGILNYIQTKMTHSDGGFFSAEDAGEVGSEGEYYVFSFEELKKTLTADELRAFAAFYGASPAGNFEGGKNVLYRAASEAASSAELAAAERKIRSLREARPRPGLDDKILCAWNGLMIGSFALGSRILASDEHLESAKRAADFIETKLLVGDSLKRRYRDGDSAGIGLLDDYAYLVDGLIALYEASAEAKYLDLALRLQRTQNREFYSREKRAFIFSKAPEMLVQKVEFFDNAVPSSNSMSLLNLERLFLYSGDLEFKNISNEALKEALSYFKRHPTAAAKFVQAADFNLGPTEEIVFACAAKREAVEFSRKLAGRYAPRTIIAFSIKSESAVKLIEGKGMSGGIATVYRCANGVCGAPESSVDAFLQEFLSR